MDSFLKTEVAQFRALFFPALYFLIYAISIGNVTHQGIFLAGYLAMGVVIVLIFINLLHEVAHETLFENKWKNRWLLVVFDLLGANCYIWKNRRIICHHGLQNITGWDSDIVQAGLLRVFPVSPHRPIHQGQHLWMFLVYPLYLINWVFIRDFKDFFNKSQTVRK